MFIVFQFQGFFLSFMKKFLGFMLRYRHCYLRQSFVTLWVCAGRKVVDGHRHYQTGAGWTEHSVFIAETIDAKGFLTPIPQGPHSKTDKKKAGRKCKRSARTKAMLAAPGRPVEATASSQWGGSRILSAWPANGQCQAASLVLRWSQRRCWKLRRVLYGSHKDRS